MGVRGTLTLQINYAQRLINENEKQRNLRLQRLRESQSIRIQAETKQQRRDRLQIDRDNTARRTRKQPPTASTKCCYVQREQEATTSTRSKYKSRQLSFPRVEPSHEQQ